MSMGTWQTAMADYAEWQRSGHRAAGTIRLHRHYLRHLAGWAGRRGPWELSTKDLRGFVAGYGQRAAETQKSARAACLGFYRWAHGDGLVPTDPSTGLASIKVPDGVAKPAPEPVLNRALARADARERIMLKLAAFGGLRCAEIAQAHRDDLVLTTVRRAGVPVEVGVLFVTGKGGKVRKVPVTDGEIIAAFRRADGHLFPGGVHGHLSPGYVTKLLSRVLEGEWTGHKLRHRFSTRSYAKNPDVLALGKVLGHAKPETTMRYVQVSDDALLAVVDAAA